ncbi:MAG: hypothetical protein RIC55_01850 [Pirellulaceae bacterium]
MGKKASSRKRAVNQFDLESALEEVASSESVASALAADDLQEAMELEDAEIKPLLQAKRDIEARLGIEEFWKDAQTVASAQAIAMESGRATLNNVKGFDVGLEMKRGQFTGNLAVRMFVQRKEDPENVAEGLLESADVRTDVIEIGGDIVAQVAPQQAQRRPALCGSSVGYANLQNRGPTGTIGCVCISKQNNYCLLSNTHVLTDAGANDPNAFIVQPGVADGGRRPQSVIGKTEQFMPLIPGGESTIDAALAITNSELVRPEHLTFTIDPRPMSPLIGQAVMKWGRTTGLTFGMITGKDAFEPIGYQRIDGSKFSSIFRNTITVQGGFGVFSKGGDSGSLIVDTITKRPILLLFAGTDDGVTTFGHPIQEVISKLQIDRLVNNTDF